ncbi:HepT-like ribonuclease domain-containing protein [Asticcacaulis sp. AND118]|nr:DUF86 domain-containing protein [Asticcacaulis sp. AND118]
MEWKNISGFRNILVHNYLGDIDPLTVQTVVDRHVSALVTVMSEALKSDD